MIRSFLRSRAAATSIEYALIATMIAIVIVASVTTTGSKLKLVFTSVSSGFR